MKILNIYSLDDTKLCNVIASLSEGKHVIGRGGLLNVSDKRVSRKHAVIDISNDKVTLTSVHINPCFFKAVNGRTLTVIKQNEENELNDGDQFALLPDDYWFRVKIAMEPTEEELFLGEQRIVKDSQSENAKKLQSLVDSNDVDENQPSTSIKIEHINTSPEQITESVVLHSQETARIEEIEQVNGMDEESYLGGKRIAENDNSLLENAKKPRLSINSNDTLDENQPSTSIKIEHVDTSHEQITESILSHSEETAQNEEINQVTNGIKEELLDYSQEQDNGFVQGTQNPQDIGENQVVKLENGEENQNGPSTSNAGPDLQQPQPRLTQRERCWYGSTCFRKNPNHRASFSHPGDPDYDPDPGDNQPECPYGTDCYRKNPDHRRQYKHTNRPVPRPNSPTTVNSQGLASPQSPLNQQRPKRKQKNKPRGQISDDDYDYSDPFLNDGSSDDYEPSDYDSSDDENSEETESQDRKRMLHEAKKFTKHKK